MVQVVENWSNIDGVVNAVRPDPDLPDHIVASVEVQSVEPVRRESGEQFPNLLAESKGQRLDLTIRTDSANRAGLAPGRRISARAQRWSPFRCFAEPERLHVD